MGTVKNFEATVIQAAEAEFVRDFADTALIAIPGDLLGGQWAGRQLAAVEVRRLLLTRGLVADENKDAVWRHLIEHSRRVGEAWTIAAIGMAVPMLKSAAKAAGGRFPDARRDDVASETLTAFLAHLAGMDLDPAGICVRVYFALRRGTDKAFSTNAEPAVARNEPCSMPPLVPCSHPDVLLARAVRAAVITEAEADLIGMTRLDKVSLTEAAECLGTTANAAKIRRQKAEARLVAFLTDQRVPARKDLKNARTRSTARQSLAA